MAKTIAKTIAVVGGGISGLSTAYYLKQAGLNVTVLERGTHAGGISRSDEVDGFTVDRGPNGFLTNVPEALELARSLGLEGELAVASDMAKHRFLFKDGALQALPASPGAFLKTRLVSSKAKARLLLEPFAPKRDHEQDETVYDFAKRRVGPEFAEVFMRSMVVGITAGDAREISLAALFPRMRKLEDDYGSLIKALLLKAREGRKKDGASGGPAGPGGRLTSFKREGVGRLMRALSESLGERVRTGAEVLGLERAAGGYTLTLASGERLKADGVVLATPAFVSARLLEALLPEAAAELAAIPYAGVQVLGLGYRREDVPHPLDGFGYLVPPGEDHRILGCLWTSSLFPTQAPGGKVLLRVIGGGVFDPDFVGLSDDEALQVVRSDLEKSLGITAAPEMAHHVRWPRGIPQYVVGHQQRVARIMAAAKSLPGLHLTGNAYHGVGLNDCVRDALRVSSEVKAAPAETVHA